MFQGLASESVADRAQPSNFAFEFLFFLTYHMTNNFCSFRN